jgi:hypothetical protein
MHVHALEPALPVTFRRTQFNSIRRFAQRLWIGV